MSCGYKSFLMCVTKTILYLQKRCYTEVFIINIPTIENDYRKKIYSSSLRKAKSFFGNLETPTILTRMSRQHNVHMAYKHEVIGDRTRTR